MLQHEKTLLDLIGRALFSADVVIPEDIDYALLHKEAVAQAVQLLVFDALTEKEKAAMPQEILNVWRKQGLMTTVLGEQVLAQQSIVLKTLAEKNIPCAVLKGSSVAANYPNPTLRAVGDIDLLVPPDLQMAATEALQEIGYGEILEEEHHCHYTVKKGKIAVEIHSEPNGIQYATDSSVAASLRELFDKALENIDQKGDIPVLSVERQAVTLLLHKLEHFLGAGLGIRQLCDWACFVNKQLTPEAFDSIRPYLKRVGLLEFCGVITLACCEYLHMPTQAAPWCLEYDKTVCEEVIETIIGSGNFGNKEQNYGQRYFVNIDAKNRISSFFKVLKTACYHHFPQSERHKILLIIAPFVIFTKYLILRLKGERDAIKPIELYKQAGPKQKLYKSLKPFKKEN